MEHLKALHQKQMKANGRHFGEKEAQRKQFHLNAISLQVDIARRDAIRDAVTYKNSTAQIVMSVDAVLLGSIFAIIYQFEPASESSQGGLVILSLLISGSILFLLLSVGFGLLFHRLVSGFHINNNVHVYQPCKKAHLTFNDYYHCHCLWSENCAVRFLFIGMGASVITAGMYQYLHMTDSTLNQYITPRSGTVVVDGDPSDNITSSDMGNESIAGEGPAILFFVLCAASAAALLLSKWVIPGRTRAGEQDLTGFKAPEQVSRRMGM
eukprot:GILI01032161.1.p1 GENE.GILI01032161.1~~GILI01032161.1.p1  ORF type:complete len:314 (+),score=40.40 GILI01032161.1:143-943(+)